MPQGPNEKRSSRKKGGGLRHQLSPSEILWILSGAPWSWRHVPDDGSPASRIHRSYRRYKWRQHGPLGRVLMCVGFVVGMPIVLGMIAGYTIIHASRIRKLQGKGPFRQGAEQLTLWLTKGVLPLSYYVFELYRDERRAAALEYIFRYETKRGIFAILRDRFSSAETTEALRSKAGFALRCEKHDVAVVPALFTIDGGWLARIDGSEPGLPHCNLFLKPLSGSGGRGAAVWFHLKNGSYQNASVGVLNESDFMQHLVKLSEREPYVGRLYVTNHPALAKLSTGALSSVRVVTCLDENNRPEVTHAVLRMARAPGIVVDNFHAGGVAARVDLATGELGAATDLGLARSTRWWETHPVTGEQILGRRLPMWKEVLDLVLHAHAAFPDQIVVGWDVALLEDGPRLIEGNKSPDLDIIQRTHGEPIGNSRFGVLLAHHLERALSDEEADRTRRQPRSGPGSDERLAAMG
jgi:hypothetical protein